MVPKAQKHKMMHRTLPLLFALLLAVTVFALSRGPSLEATRTEGENGRAGSIPGRYIVLLKDDVSDSRTQALALAQQFGFSVDVTYAFAVKGFAANMGEAAADALRRNPLVAVVEQDQVATAFPQTIPTGIRRIRADQNGIANINGAGPDLNVDVAVLDTGVQTNHPDLRVVGGVAIEGVCSTFLCMIGWQPPTCTQTSNYSDGNGHGTHVAGTIAAKDNSDGVVGVAPGARIWAVGVLGANGSGYMSCIIAGVDWVTANASTIAVANMSLGGGNSSALCTAIGNSIAAGVVYVVAAGNSNTNAGNTSPANCAGAVTVSAVADYNGQPGGGASPTCGNGSSGQDDSFASFSNYGSVVDIAAPGVCILSTYINSGYATMSGTSMASPHVAGAVLLDVLANGKPTNSAQVQAVRNRLVSSAFPKTSACGYTGANSSAPLLNVGPPCSGAAPTATNTPGAANTPTPTNTPAPAATATSTPTPAPTGTLPTATPQPRRTR
jgi:subtilisin